MVVGAGTGGLVAAAGSAGAGAKVALDEEWMMGGDCLNVGCVPSKAIIRCVHEVQLLFPTTAAHICMSVHNACRPNYRCSWPGLYIYCVAALLLHTVPVGSEHQCLHIRMPLSWVCWKQQERYHLVSRWTPCIHAAHVQTEGEYLL